MAEVNTNTANAGEAATEDFVPTIDTLLNTGVGADRDVIIEDNTVPDKKITFLGWAFKKDTNDTRESAAIYVADDLINEQANITVYDPKVEADKVFSDLNYLESRSKIENKERVTVAVDPYEACVNAHAIAVLTEWDEFITYDWNKIYHSMQKPAFVFDGRNVLNRVEMEKIGFVYQSVGS